MEDPIGAVNQIKDAMKSVQPLSLPNFEEEFIMETNASGFNFTTVLSQYGRLIAFLNHALSRKAMMKSIYERELMAMVFAIQKWRHYLLRWCFIICIDEKSLKFLFDQRIVAPKCQW